MIESPLIDELFDELFAERLAEAESKARKEAMQEGMQEAMQGAIIEVLRTRFGEVPAELENRIRSVQDQDDLTQMTRQAAACRDLEAELGVPNVRGEILKLQIKIISRRTTTRLFRGSSLDKSLMSVTAGG
jgi:hypothetical protein